MKNTTVIFKAMRRIVSLWNTWLPKILMAVLVISVILQAQAYIRRQTLEQNKAGTQLPIHPPKTNA